MMDSAIRGTLIVSAMNDVYFGLSFSKKVNDGLKRRAVGKHNQSDVYLAIVKSGNENGAPAPQTFVCKSQKRHVSFEYLTIQASRDTGDAFMRVPEWDKWIADVPVSSKRVCAGAECEESRMRGGKSYKPRPLLVSPFVPPPQTLYVPSRVVFWSRFAPV